MMNDKIKSYLKEDWQTFNEVQFLNINQIPVFDLFEIFKEIYQKIIAPPLPLFFSSTKKRPKLQNYKFKVKTYLLKG